MVFSIVSLRRSAIIAYSIFLFSVLAIYFSWQPEKANLIANYLGVGRGADLLLYLWFLVSSSMFLLANLKLNKLHQELTEVSRFVAISESKQSLHYKTELLQEDEASN
jgi:hypothetical protein